LRIEGPFLDILSTVYLYATPCPFSYKMGGYREVLGCSCSCSLPTAATKAAGTIVF